jgi:hypothetical protein
MVARESEMRVKVALSIAAALVAATPALAVTNLITNGSFEADTAGATAFIGWTKSGTVGDVYPASVIAYGSGASYPGGAFGEAVTPDNVVGSGSPDAVGTKAAYFVSDLSVNESLTQLTYLTPGNYRVGFSFYLTANGLANVNNSSLKVTILSIPVAMTNITGSSTGQTWFYATGVGQIVSPGFYPTALVFNSNGDPSKDVVVDRVFAISTTDAADVVIPAIPEPATWAMLVAGFGMVGFGLRRRRPTVVAA